MPKHPGLSLALLAVMLVPCAGEAQALPRLEMQGRSGQNLVLVTRAGSNAPFSNGDVLAAVGNGKIKHFSPDGTLVRILDTLDNTPGSRNTTGMAWDRSDNLYVTLFTDDGSIFGPNPYPGNVYKFDQFGNLLGPFGGGYNAHPESVVLDEAGNVYVGQADGQKKILKFSSEGTTLDSYLPGAEARGVDWFDLANDQRTIFYTSEGKHVRRFDLWTKTQLSDFGATPLPGTRAYGLRILLTGGLLVADSESIVRLDSNGNVVQQYTAPGENAWFALNLDPDGQTFWSGGYSTGQVYRFDIATGQLLTKWNTVPFTVLGGLTVFREQTVATCSVTCSASALASAVVGTSISFQGSSAPSHCSGSVGYSWDFGDGSASSQQNASHAYSSAGTFSWTMTATVGGVTCTKSGVIAISTGPPASDLTWEPAGGPTDGVAQVKVSATGSVFLGTHSNGVLRSDDSGSSWLSKTSGLGTMDTGVINVTPEGTVFAGAHNNGVYRSLNRGDSWTKVSATPSTQTTIMSVAGAVYVADGFWCTGVYRSYDNGSSWTPVSAGLAPCVNGLAKSPSGTMVAATGTSGVYRSTNSGAAWTSANGGTMAPNLNAVAVNASGWFFVASHGGGGVYRSTDDGVTWGTANSGLPTGNVYSLSIEPSGRLLAGTETAGVFMSLDNGDTWREENAGLPGGTQGISSIAVDPSGRAYAVVNGRVYRSTVTVVASPQIRSFAANPSTITAGGSSTLSWTTSNATSVSIDHGLGVQPVNGSVNVSPMGTTTYTLTATGPGGTATATTTVTANPVTPAPTVTSFTATPSAITAGGSSTLAWTTSNATSVSVDQGLGVQPINGSVIVSPTATTTYTLTVTGPSGTATATTATTTVTVTSGSGFPPVVFAHGICSTVGKAWNGMAANLHRGNPQRFRIDKPISLCFDNRLVRDMDPDHLDLFFDPATQQTTLPQSSMYGIAYYNRFTGSCGEEDVSNVSIADLGDQLAHVIDAVRATNGSGPVDIVAHSMGGLVIRTYLERLTTTAYKPGSVHTVVTIDTPHAGFSKSILDPLFVLFDGICAGVARPDCSRIPDSLKCLLSENEQKNEMDDLRRDRFLDPLNHLDIPSEVTVVSFVGRGGFNSFSDGVVAAASQDLKQVTSALDSNPRMPHYMCATNVLTWAIDGVPTDDVVEVHTTVTDYWPTAHFVDWFLGHSVRLEPCQTCSVGQPTRIATPTTSPGSPSVTITFAQNVSSTVTALLDQPCTADVIARAQDGTELDRRTVVAAGTQTVQFGLLTMAGWYLEIVTTCNETVSARVDVQPATEFGSARTTQVVPVVLDVNTGAAHYTSEVTLTNRGTTPSIATMRFTSTTGQGGGRVSRLIPAGSQVVFGSGTDYLRAVGLPLPNDGTPIVGTMVVDWSGLSDGPSSAVLTRTTTATTSPQPVGAAGLAYTGILSSTSSSPVTLFGLRQNASDRSNVAVFNPTSDQVTVKVTAYAGDASGYSRVISNGQTLSGYGWYQFNGVLDGTGITSGWVTVERVSSAGSFNAYGVINDNVTNDGSFVTSTATSVGGTTITVPALVEAGPFRSELVLANKSGNPVTLTLSYRESLSPSSGAGGSTTVTLRPTEQLIIPGTIDYLRSRGISVGASGAASYAGALRISVSGASLSDVYAGARTASQSPAGGQFGLFTPGIYESEAATTDAYLYGLRSDELNRSNVAVANVGSDSSGPVTLVLHFFDGDFGGVETGGAETVTLAPGEWKQFSNILKTKGIRNGWVHVVRTSGSVPWIAYGVINDGGNPGERTGDGAYVPMVASGGGAGNVVIMEFTIPTEYSYALGIASGPDGNLWFTESTGNKVGRITPSGVITEFTVPTASSGPYFIVSGPDGNLWFTEDGGNKIGRITAAGTITEFTVPTANSWPYGIASGPDGKLWFTEYGSNKIGRMTTAGAITEFTVPTASSGPAIIASGPDGNLWFTEETGNKIGRITTAGIITEFAVPTANSIPWGITTSPDGNLWFTEYGSNKIGRMTTAGVITEFTVPTANSQPSLIATGPDGKLWFTESSGNKIGRINPSGVITEFMLPTAGSGPSGITSGTDGNIWFTEETGNKIGRISNIN